MNKNSQPEPEPASFEDARENVRDVGHTIMFASTGAGKSVSIAGTPKNRGQVFSDRTKTR